MVFSLIAKEVLGLQVNLVRGYQGAAPIFLAMQRGEVDGQVIGLSSIQAGQRALWDGKELRPLLQFGRLTRLPELPDVPTGRELAKDDKAQGAAGVRRAAVLHGAAVRAPPDVPARPRQGAAIGLHGDVPGPGVPRRRRASSASTSARSTATPSPALLARAAATPKDVIDRFNEIEKK